MRIVYDAYTTLDAHVVKNLLESEGIEAHIQGEYLQGGVGELSAMNLVKVTVSDGDAERAHAIVEAWDAQQADDVLPRKSAGGEGGWIGLLIFAAGFLVGAVFTFRLFYA